ncbi:MAG: hypothetical protein AUI14_23765 [Actinobacteria bacterium 13_2_20CM_2_71_6]|nr:MAG: hypothetical protein AUI14_23765 [Actinobacteria bacterium 13_2_20CM_2_71_6]
MVAVVAGVAALAGVSAALAVWLSTSPPSTVHAGAATMPVGSRPDATASAATVTVSWAAVSVGDHPVSGYRLTRYDAAGHPEPARNGCAGVVTSTGCVESGVPDGAWGYVVTPVQGTHWTGADSPQGTVYVATVGVTFPVSGQVYGIDSYAAGCGTKSAGDMCGTASGAKPVNVSVSVRQGSGRYWNPGDNTFSSDSEKLHPLGTGANWKLPFPVSTFPASGLYTLRAVATDSTGRVSSTSSTFTVYPQAPPVPAIENGPADPTNQTSARFTFSSAVSTVECSLDNATFASCGSPTTIAGPLAKGTHRFRVRAVDAGGNTSAPATYTWTVDTTAPRATDVQASNRAGGTAGLIESGDSLTLSFSEPVAPGSVVPGWNGASPVNVSLSFDAGTQAVSVGGSALGTVAFGRPGYVLHGTTVGGTVSMNGADLVITIGTVADPGAFGTVTDPGTMTWIPGAVRDPAGNSLANAGTDVAERHPGGLDTEF